MFAWWGRAVVRTRWAVLVVGAAVVLVGATWGLGVFGALTGGGFDDPDSETVRTRQQIAGTVGSQDVDLLVLYSSPRLTVDDPAFREPLAEAAGRLRQRPEVASVVSWPETGAPRLVSTDRHASYLVIGLRGKDADDKAASYDKLLPDLEIPGLTSQAGGSVAFLRQANEQTTEDITRAELLSMPVLLVLLVLVFGGLVAAMTPLLIGVLAILGAFVATRLLTGVTEVSVFAINIITLLGLGMAIDYALFIISRFREELAAGGDVEVAIGRTIQTAGRTVTISGLTVALALASLLIFPQPFLRSMGLGGMAAVLVAMLASLTVLPALLAVLGARINALRVPLPWRRRGKGGAVDGGQAGAAWGRLARAIMRRPVIYVVGVSLVLLFLAAPAVGIKFGGLDERVLPAGTAARVVSEQLAERFPGGSAAPVDVLLIGADPAQAQQFAARIEGLPDASGTQIIAAGGGAVLLAVGYPGEPTGDRAQALVRSLRSLGPPAGAQLLVGGRTAATVDLLASLRSLLPWMALAMASAILILLLAAFGSVLLPIKAVLMNLISVGASFGVVVWGFQEGHLAGLLDFTSTGFIEPTNPILLLAVLFGLATDYEVFLLSRVREEWDRTGDNTAAVVRGVQQTGGIITAAAALLIIVVAGFAAGGIVFIKLIGVGMIVAIVVDATLVRALLVPATMRLLGTANWWLPGPLAGLYRRFGISEADPVEAAEPAREPISV